MRNQFWALCLLASIAVLGCKPGPEGQQVNGIDQDTIPVDGDWIRIYHPSDPDGLHPYATRNAFANYIKENIFMFLCDLEPNTLELVPSLAKALPEVSEDQLSFTFEIREEAHWDDGSPVTGEDAAFSFKCILNPLGGAPHMRGYYLDFIKDVNIDPANPRKFTVSITQHFFLAETAIAGVDIVSKKFYDPKGLLDGISIPDFISSGEALSENENLKKFSEEFSNELIGRDPEKIYGCGPYKVESMNTGSNVTLVRKKDWWGDKIRGKAWYFQAYAQKLIYKTITDRGTLPAAARAGELDIVRDMSPTDFREAMEDTSSLINKNFNFFTPASFSYIYLGFNCKPPADRTPKLEDKRVRQAIAHLVNIDQIIEDVYDGFGKVQPGPVTIVNKNEFNPNIRQREFSIEKAKALLDEAGWVDTDGNGIRDKMIKGKKVQLQLELILSNTSETGPQLARMVADQAIKAGVQIDLQPIEFNLLANRLRDHQFDICGLGFQASPLPTDLMQVWHTEAWSNQGSNYFGFGNAETDSIIETIRTVMTAEKRKPLYWRFQEIFAEEMPMVVVMSPTERIMINKRFKNARGYSSRPGYKVSELWVPKENQKFQ